MDTEGENAQVTEMYSEKHRPQIADPPDSGSMPRDLSHFSPRAKISAGNP